jgi:hypothetical protein
MMVIQYLQCVSPAVVPCLQEIVLVDINGIPDNHFVNPFMIKWKSSNMESIGIYYEVISLWLNLDRGASARIFRFLQPVCTLKDGSQRASRQNNAIAEFL